MATLTVQNLTTAGLNASFTAASSVDEFANNGHTFLWVKNAAASTNAVVVTSQVSPVPVGLVALDVTVDVTASGSKLSGFFSVDAYNDSSGCVKLRPTTHTDLSYAAISVT